MPPLHDGSHATGGPRRTLRSVTPNAGGHHVTHPGQPAGRVGGRVGGQVDRLDAPLPLDEACGLLGDDSTLFVDIREPQEWEREGIIPGAYRAPRGMLEFWIDPASPYHRPVLDDGRRLVLYCASAWRSALAVATLREMGRDDVTHIAGASPHGARPGIPSSRIPRQALGTAHPVPASTRSGWEAGRSPRR
ncbi:rhodanese-like domain-containing protein [Tessaracoccus coleopterorum]|uniref:rhodanese-like domain-containing protein n=1 Tax=Tessaracoccus coleopterorum TaxID=2714950 RepID=UPI0018D2A857